MMSRPILVAITLAAITTVLIVSVAATPAYAARVKDKDTIKSLEKKERG